jgi:hypothetical protein
MIIEKQLLIHRFPIPTDLQNIIKEYCFYYINTSKIRLYIQGRKRRINYKINSLCVSRANPYSAFINYINIEIDENCENCEGWYFMNYGRSVVEFIMEGVNCKYCGNYKSTSINFELVPEAAKCYCAIDRSLSPKPFG